MRHALLTFSSLLALSAQASPQATYEWLRANVFAKKCQRCHDTGSSTGVELMTYDGLMASQAVVAGDAENSLLYRAVVPEIPGARPLMPLALREDEQPDFVTDEEAAAIAEWIRNGAEQGPTESLNKEDSQ